MISKYNTIYHSNNYSSQNVYNNIKASVSDHDLGDFTHYMLLTLGN